MWHGITSVVEEGLSFLMLSSLHFYPPTPVSYSKVSSAAEVMGHWCCLTCVRPWVQSLASHKHVLFNTLCSGSPVPKPYHPETDAHAGITRRSWLRMHSYSL